MMQTIPSCLFDTSGDVAWYWQGSGADCCMYYAVPPIVRLTNLGIRLVDEEVLRQPMLLAQITGSGCGVFSPVSASQYFCRSQSDIMMALAMVVIASMIGVRSWGAGVAGGIQPVSALGLMNGLAIVAIAIILIVSQKYGLLCNPIVKGLAMADKNRDPQPFQSIW